MRQSAGTHVTGTLHQDYQKAGVIALLCVRGRGVGRGTCGPGPALAADSSAGRGGGRWREQEAVGKRPPCIWGAGLRQVAAGGGRGHLGFIPMASEAIQ